MAEKTMKILLIADSYALPRLATVGNKIELNYQQTYPQQLRQELRRQLDADIMLLVMAEHAQVTTCLNSEMPLQVSFFEPDYIVIQLGLADLWPATATRVAPRYPSLAGKDPWVTLTEYRENIQSFVENCRQQKPTVQISLVNIPRVSENQYWHYPQAYERTQTYNKCLQVLAKQLQIEVLDWYTLIQQVGEQLLGSDGIHPNVAASRMLGQALAEIIIKQAGENNVRA